MFFYLNSEILHLQGQNASFIYNLETGKKEKLNSLQTQLLNQLQLGTSINQLKQIYTKDIEELIQFLLLNELGQLYDKQVYVPRIRTHETKFLKSNILKPFQLNRAVIELTGECNMNCQFCTPENVIYRSCGCKKWVCENENLALKDWEDTVQNIIKLGVKQVIFSGGEPFLRWDILKHLIEQLSRHQIRCTVITNGTLIDNLIGSFLKNHQVDLVLQVFEYTSEGYLHITGQEESFRALCESFEIIEKYNIQHTISVVISSLNQDHLDDIKKFFVTKKMSIMYLYPTNKYFPDKMLPQIFNPADREIPVNIRNYQLLENYHNCLYGQIFISADGTLYPCMMMRHEKDNLGNILKEPLYKVFNEQRHIKYWTTPKQEIQGCDKCARNLFCFDCRALDSYASGTYKGMKYCSEINQGQEKVHVEESKVSMEL